MFIKKMLAYLSSIIWYSKNKLINGKKLSCKLLNGINGKLDLRLNKDSKLLISGKIFCDGPIYFNVGTNAKMSIGERCYFNHNCSVTALEEIAIGDNCYFGNNLVIVDHNHIIKNGKLLNEFNTAKIMIGDNVWVGANSTITAGVRIGNNTIIAANSVVTKDIPSGVIAAGVPARIIKKVS